MTEQELRNKIVDVLSNMQNFGERLEQISQTGPLKIAKIIVSNEKIADALIAAEIGDVTEWKDKATAAELVAQAAANAAIERIEEWKHRAEVAERALDLINKENPSCFVPYSCRGLDCRECTKKYFYEQAEKELAEERKDG